MAIREIRKEKDEILRKNSRTVEKIDDKIIQLLEDMIETMHCANGVGLAAPQVGILKRMAVVDIGDGVIELINPEIIYIKGEEIDVEGCLSIPGVFGQVSRPRVVKVSALNRYGEECEYKGEGLLARAFCHEIDHLDGGLFTDKVLSYVNSEEE